MQEGARPDIQARLRRAPGAEVEAAHGHLPGRAKKMAGSKKTVKKPGRGGEGPKKRTRLAIVLGCFIIVIQMTCVRT